MNTVVCLKQVPDTETLIKIAGTGIATDGIKWVISPYDEFAVEEALKMKEKMKAGNVTIVSLGPDRAIESIRTALAMGADTAVHVNDAAYYEKADPFATAAALAAAVKGLEYDAVFLGKQAMDDDSGQVPAMLGELLGIPVVTQVIKIEVADDKSKASVTREVEGGHALLDVSLPAVFSAQKGLNEPRYASLPGIMKAKKKPVDVKKAADLGVSDGPKTVVKELSLPPARQAGRIIQGDDAKAKAAALAKALHDEVKII
ncbi:MAG TPA: electron transfer flavoprotein beta subunit/FixA family protein [Deltaproteobacteria bacterium]|nr:electron transfer flavoprotein subunit beta/FixA family protein [Desulfomonilia bacterium]HDP26174.1 electron transfer flavoprotein beta subunit/FixA family protein [Deltaproteobacteria bacterium]